MPTEPAPGIEQQLLKLIDHLEWADKRTLDSLRAMPQVDARALELYAHVLGAEHVWVHRMAEETPRVAVWPVLSLDEAASVAEENAKALRALVESHPADQLQRIVPYRNSAGVPLESSLEDMLLQVVTHGCYHRGQVALLVRGAGAEPSPTDYIAFARGVPAATRR